MATTVVSYNGDGNTTAFTYAFSSLSETYVVTSVTVSYTHLTLPTKRIV